MRTARLALTLLTVSPVIAQNAKPEITLTGLPSVREALIAAKEVFAEMRAEA